MTRGFNKDLAITTVSNSGSPVLANAATIHVASNGATDFPTSGSFSVKVVNTGLVLEITGGAGTTTWTVGTWGADGTTSLIANIPDGAQLEEVLTADDLETFLQRTETGLPTSMLSTTTPIVDGTGAVGTSTKAARADHVHPASGSGAADATTSSVGVVEVDHTPSGAHPIAMTLDGTAIPSGMLSSSTPAADGAGTGGTAVTASRSDHQHPTTDATTSAVGMVEIDHAPVSGHPVALTQAGTALPTTMLGTTGTTAAAGNDSRLSNARTPTGTAGGDLTGTYPNPTLGTSGVTAGSYGDGTHVPAVTVDAKGRITGVTSTSITGTPPGGTAGGDLTGTYPNPTVAAGAITDTKVASANKDGTAGTASLRTLGTGAQQAAAGNDSRFSTISGEMTASDFKPTGLTGATAASRYVGGTTSGAPATGTFLTGDFIIDQGAHIYVCTAGGSPGTWAGLTGGAGSATLAGDTDANISSPANFDQLQYQTSDNKWHNAKGGLVKLNGDAPLGSAQASITLSSIPSGYRHLELYVNGRGTAASSNAVVQMQFNADSGSNYDWQQVDGNGSSSNAEEHFAVTFIRIAFIAAATAPANCAGGGRTTIFDYADTTFQKACTSEYALKLGTSTGDLYACDSGGWWRNTAAITSITLTLNSGNFDVGTVVSLYGIV